MAGWFISALAGPSGAGVWLDQHHRRLKNLYLQSMVPVVAVARAIAHRKLLCPGRVAGAARRLSSMSAVVALGARAPRRPCRSSPTAPHLSSSYRRHRSCSGRGRCRRAVAAVHGAVEAVGAVSLCLSLSSSVHRGREEGVPADRDDVREEHAQRRRHEREVDRVRERPDAPVHQHRRDEPRARQTPTPDRPIGASGRTTHHMSGR